MIICLNSIDYPLQIYLLPTGYLLFRILQSLTHTPPQKGDSTILAMSMLEHQRYVEHVNMSNLAIFLKL